MAMASSISIRFEEAQSYALAQLGMPQLSLKEERKQASHVIYSSRCGCLLNSGRVYVSRHWLSCLIANVA